MVSLLSWDDQHAAATHKVVARVGFQIRLELNDGRVQRSVETRRCRQRVDKLREHAVQFPPAMSCRASLSITAVRSASLSMECSHKTVLHGSDGGRRDVRTNSHSEAESRLLSVAEGHTFQKQTPVNRARCLCHTQCKPSHLQGSAVVSQFPCTLRRGQRSPWKWKWILTEVSRLRSGRLSQKKTTQRLRETDL